MARFYLLVGILLCFTTFVNSTCFGIGFNNASYYPNYIQASVDDIKFEPYQSVFITEYNENGGFPFLSGAPPKANAEYCVISVEEGVLVQIEDIFNNWWTPFDSLGEMNCVVGSNNNRGLASPVLLGDYVGNDFPVPEVGVENNEELIYSAAYFYPTLNETVLENTTTTYSFYTSYSLYIDTSCKSPPAPPPAPPSPPPPPKPTCCVYFSCDEVEGITVCAKPNYPCPVCFLFNPFFFESETNETVI
eukprot:TRINITY_DN3982_c0_g1_i2.p1 TRINITY_DN3982_c0_g1~~TRINITY_DN3982_c0_g1_i2.p1  ORF type:complete len:247 (+),score=31.13 TRINITY_DN3982_c0_g1_i2:82-822(+)